MPLHIDIRVNRELINTLHIARVKGGTDPDDINDYIITDGPELLRHEDWLIDGIPFTHRYGDGAEVCVMKGIQAITGFAGGPVGKEVW
jgi:hypothetical protein